MHEYRLADNKTNSKPLVFDSANKKASLRLDDWVLCRIYKKNNPPRPMDRERDDSMSDMLAIIPPCSIQVNQQNPRLQALKAGNFGSFLEKEHNLFEEMIGEGDISNNLTGYINISQLGISNSKPLHPMVTSSTSNALPLKRTLPSVYWTDGGGSCSPSSSAAKRFHVDASGGSTVKPPMDENSSIASLLSSLSQLPQTPSLHQETVMGPLGDGIFRWYS
ncbi:hypothetical protein U1Q18_000621 [Sarracenia purpurea var. burkii]